MNITNNVTISGTGLWAAQTLQAEFLRASKSYSPDTDPRLPLHGVLAANLTANANIIVVSNISAFPAPNLSSYSYGLVRIKQEAILYGARFEGNSSLGVLTRTFANTTSSGNVISGNLVTILGLRTVNP
jgi:hypothetical protein